MKAKEIRELGPDDMRKKEAELQKELFNLRMRHSTKQLENPLRLRTLRKDLALIKTIIAEKGRK